MEALALAIDVLDWATDRAGETLHSFAEKVAKREKDRARITEGRLTISQAEKLAKEARIPFGYLFLSEPPKVSRPSIPDLRTIQGSDPLGDEFYETLEDILAKQEWFAEYLAEVGAPELPFVGKFAKTSQPDAIVKDMKSTLRLSGRDRSGSADPGGYFSTISEKAEAAGILVFKSGYVKSNTRRLLSEREFRGFALVHNTAPAVFINGRDANVAAVFTLVHELAHIWTGVSGVSDVVPSKFSRASEKLCNQVAADILVPIAEFSSKWNGPNSLDEVARFFRVSRLVIARRALDEGLASQDFYDSVAATSSRVDRKGKPNALVTIPIRNSKKFTKTIVASALSGQTLLRDAASLLNVKPDTVVALSKGRSSNG